MRHHSTKGHVWLWRVYTAIYYVIKKKITLGLQSLHIMSMHLCQEMNIKTGSDNDPKQDLSKDDNLEGLILHWSIDLFKCTECLSIGKQMVHSELLQKRHWQSLSCYLVVYNENSDTVVPVVTASTTRISSTSSSSFLPLICCLCSWWQYPLSNALILRMFLLIW